LRAILASATSLLALLLVEVQETRAAPTGGSVSSPSLDFGNVLVGDAAVSLSDIATINGGAGTTLSFGTPSSPFGGGGQTVAVTNNTSQSLVGTFTFAPLTTGAATPQNVLVSDVGAGGTFTSPIALSGSGVAPSQAITSSNPYVLIGQSGPVSLTVSNTGNGNLSGRGTVSNLRGTVSASNSVFVGTGGSFSLGDSTQTTTPTTATFAYTFAPTKVGAASTVVSTTFANGTNASNAGGSVATTLNATGVAPIQSVTPASASVVARVGTTASSTVTVANVGNGNLAGTGTAYNLNGTVTNSLGAGFTAAVGNQNSISLASNATASAGSTATTSLGYNFTPTSRGTSSSTVSIAFSNGNAAGTNLSESVARTVAGSAVGPVYASTIQGATATNTPTAVAKGATGSATATIALGNVRSYSSRTVFLELDNTTNDVAAAGLTNLTIESYAISGANAGSFSISSFGANSIIAEGGHLIIPITVVTAGIGALNSTLTIFTDESVGLGGVGDTFTYSLSAFSVPEPTSILVLAAGLGGLANVRRRRRPASRA